MIIELKELKNIDIRTNEENQNEYLRITFEGEDETGIHNQYKTTMSKEQFQELKTVMEIEYDNVLEIANVKKPLTIEILEGEVTNGKKPQPLLEAKFGTYKGYAFSYYNIHSGAFIKNKIISPNKFNNLKDFF